MNYLQEPQGLPVTTFAKVQTEPGIFFNVKNKKTIKLNESDKETEFEFVYDHNSSDDNIFEKDLNKLIPLVLEGYNSCLISLGGNNSEKREILQGIVHISIESLVNTIRQNNELVNNTDIEYFAVEIYEDVIQKKVKRLIVFVRFCFYFWWSFFTFFCI